MNDKITPPTVWALTRTEYAGQCTGFSSETRWLGIFHKLPDLKTLAPFLSPHLSTDMGEAINQAQTLLDTKGVTINVFDFSLEKLEIGVRFATR